MADFMPNLPDDLKDRLDLTYEDLQRRYDELLAAIDRMPSSCDDDSTARKMTDFAGQIAACVRSAETSRKTEKRPWLEGSRTVDGFFNDITAPLERHKKAIEQMVGQYQWKKQEAARKAAEEAARIAREEMERLMAAADANIDDAIARDEEAREQAAIAALRPVELSRIHGDLATGSLRVEYDYTLEDLAAVPLRFLMLNDSAIKAHIRSRPQDGEPEPVPGLTFTARHVTRIRS